jgi:predicted nuclease of predicted toxin-antitoxin system
MKFLLDANLPGKLVGVFIAAGYDCVHMESLMPRYSADTTIARMANETGAVVVSRDADFAQLVEAGVLRVPLVWVRLGNMRRAAIAAAIEARLPAIVTAIDAGQQIVILR